MKHRTYIMVNVRVAYNGCGHVFIIVIIMITHDDKQTNTRRRNDEYDSECVKELRVIRCD